MPDLLDLPPELLLLIAENSEAHDISSLCQCSRALYSLLTSTLYKRAITTSSDSGYRYLLHCTIHDNLPAFIQLLTHGADPTSGGSYLGQLLRSNYMNVPKSKNLYDMLYAYVDTRDRTTLLHLASCTGSSRVLSHLLTLPAFDPYMLDSSSGSPIERAAVAYQFDSACVLLDAMTSKSSPFYHNFTMDQLHQAFIWAADSDDTAIISELFSRRFTDPHDPRVLLSWDTNILAQALYSAVYGQRTGSVEILLAHDADPDSCPGLVHPLIIAASHGSIEIVRMLLEKGVDPDVLCQETGSDNGTALVVAARLAARLLSLCRLDIDAEGKYRYESESEENFYLARGDEENSILRFWKVATVLVEAGADIAWAKFLLDKDLKEELDGRKQKAMEFLDSLERKYRSKCPIEGLLNP
ncbi:ankyrin [Ascodesmis nigricans]|uniref:Ankyrin n=1 Tax=Ascodesmis nigricans TaxID=341454 RepID=A0A4S2MS34_9PEZI|nr:ankyrin [Ascodesmis nigricans]